jgi:hypothetical protein
LLRDVLQELLHSTDNLLALCKRELSLLGGLHHTRNRAQRLFADRRHGGKRFVVVSCCALLKGIRTTQSKMVWRVLVVLLLST